MTTAKRDLLGISTRRAFFLGGLGTVGFGAIGARLVYLQTLDPSDYQGKAEENQFDTWFVPPSRGVVYDRFGEKLAITSRDYRVLVTPEQTDDLEATIAKIGALLALPPETIARKTREAKAARKFDPVMIRQGLTWDQFAAINVRLPELPGVRAEAGEQRFYPYMSAFAHPIGYVQKPSDRDIERIVARERERAGIPDNVPIDPPEARYLRNPDARVGKTGLEARLETLLKGEPGLKKVEVNASGRVVSEIGREERRAQPGAGVVLTLDAEIQRIAMERMGGESAACVIMDVENGEVLVMASAPGYDPNAFVNGISSAEFKRLNSPEPVGPDAEMRDLKRLYHKAVKGAYKPGSTFKVVTGIAALAAGLPENFRASCPGHYDYGGRRFHCWKKGGHGSVDLRAAIKGSCNVFFYQAALHAGPDRIAQVARDFGFGTAFDIDLPMGEMEDGIVPDPAWFRRVRKEPWPAGNTLNVGIGQGDVLVTPLQLAVMTARLANGGKAIVPHLVREAPDRKPAPPPRDLGFNPAHVARVVDGLVAVCEPGGTAFASAGQLKLARDKDGRVVPAELAGPGAPPVRMAGKTGTAQVRVITAAERARGVKRNEDLPWPLRDHALFVFFAPIDKPRYAGAVIVEHGMGGSRIAAPIAADIMRALLLRDPANRKPMTLTAADPAGAPA